MNITDSKVRFMKDGNIYTLLQKDEDGRIKLHYKGNVINIVTKQEVLDNLQNINYKDTIKIGCYLNGELIQLAVKEDIEYLYNTYKLPLNNKNTEIVYDAEVCVANDENITLITITTDEVLNTVNYNTNTELIFNNATQDPSIGSMLSIADLDQTKVSYDLSNESIDENYSLNNTTTQSGYRTLSYALIEEV